MIKTVLNYSPGNPLRLLIGGAFLATLVGLWPTAEARGTEPVAPNLTPKLQKLLADEMVAILQASQQIVAALAAGDHATVAKNAQAIRASFILGQNLTEQGRQDLEAALPPAFLELDGDFHRMAAKLEESARRQDPDLEHYYFTRMLEICQTCHGKYAMDKFPGLSGKAPVTHAP